MQKGILLSAPGLGDSLWMVLAFLGESRSPSSRCMARLRDALRRSALSPVPALLYKEASSILWPFSTILQMINNFPCIYSGYVSMTTPALIQYFAPAPAGTVNSPTSLLNTSSI